MRSERLRVVDLYCGAGGFSFGFQQEGFDILALGHRSNDKLINSTQSVYAHLIGNPPQLLEVYGRSSSIQYGSVVNSAARYLASQ